MRPESTTPFEPWRHRFACVTAASTLFLVFAGGLVTSTGSGLAVPDWPLSFGKFFPPMVGGVFYEHGHRMIATVVGMLTVVLAGWTWARETRGWVRRVAAAALFAVVLQGILGGLTVLFLLPTAVSVSHACLGQAFLCLLVTIAVATSRGWVEHEAPSATPAGTPSARSLSVVAVTALFAQLVLGALMRHMGAGLAIPDFPTAFGGLVPPLEDPGVVVHFAHRMGAVLVTALLVWTALRTLRVADLAPGTRPLAISLFVLLGLQWTLGALTVWTGKAVTPATLHVATGASILATTVALSLRLHHAFAPATATDTATAAFSHGSTA